MHLHNSGDPSKTPFVYYASGIPVYPANNVYEIAHQALADRGEKTLKSLLKERIVRGFVGGALTTLPDSWWNQFFFNYVSHFSNNFSEPHEIEDRAGAALEIMISKPPNDAWMELTDFIVGQIDILSGWNKSWIKESAEQKGIKKGEDGNYYFDDVDGIRVQVIGAKTLPETHLDFVTEHILRNFGCLRQVLNVFSVLAIADEYSRDPARFPRSMKAIFHSNTQSTAHTWRLMQFQRTRTVKWRPFSNFCDPDWLAADLLGRLTDTLDRDVWRDRVDKQKDRPNKLDDDCTRQMDYVLDSSLSIGSEEEIYFPFEGRTFRWVNGSAEAKATISVGYKDPNSHKGEDESLNRLLSVLVWQHRQPIVKEEGVGGPKRPIPHIWAPRSNFGLRVDPQYLFLNVDKYSPERWLALALYKEGTNSKSVFYEFFSYWKIIEVAIKEKKARFDWINKTAPLLGVEKDRVQEVLKQNPTIADYLDNSCRNAIAHVFRQPIVNPDDYGDYVRISQDVRVVEELARRVVDEHLTVPNT